MNEAKRIAADAVCSGRQSGFCLRWVGICVLFLVLSANSRAENQWEDCVIQDAALIENVALPYMGDLWPATWAADGKVYLAFGDGSGMSGCLPVEGLDWPHGRPRGKFSVWDVYGGPDDDFCGIFPCGQTDRYPLCPYTRTGVIALAGNPPDFRPCRGLEQCVVSRHLPTGMEIPENDVKPSSLLAIGKRLYLHLHRPSARPRKGVIAVSNDGGRSWREKPGSPWGKQSHFRVMMFLQQGKGHRLSRDGYVYAYGISNEIDIQNPELQPVYLARVRVGKIGQYSDWKYFAGLNKKGKPRWRSREAKARPLPNIKTMVQGSAMFHPGSKRYLFFSGFVGIVPARELDSEAGKDELIEAAALYEAPHPWGPWRRVAYLPGGYIGGLIPKGSQGSHIYITGAGNTLTYNLNVGRVQLAGAASAGPENGAVAKALWAFYYPWYRLQDWAHIPGPDKPAKPYSSDDPKAIRRHIRQARNAGIDGFIVSWMGPSDASDRVFKLILREAAKQRFRISIYLETLDDIRPRPVAQLKQWLSYLLKNYGRNPAFARVNGKPVVWIYAAESLPPKAWADIFASLRTDGLDLFTVATGEDTRTLQVFDGLHVYEAYTVPDMEKTYPLMSQHLRRTVREMGLRGPKLFVPAVQPGYDERAIPGREGGYQPRQDGAFYRRTFEAAHSADPRWIVITSWNEWPEQTYIEPSKRYGDLFLRITRKYADW